MLIFDFISEERDKDSKLVSPQRLIVNGIADYNSFYAGSPLTESKSSFAVVSNNEVIKILKKATVDDFKQTFQELTLKRTYLLENFEVDIVIQVDYVYSNFQNTDAITFALNFHAEHWNRPYSISDLSEELQRRTGNTAGIKFLPYHGKELESKGFGLSFQFHKTNVTIDSLIQFYQKHFDTIIKESTSYLIEKSDREILTAIFQFPETMKNACKQYLIYFAQFLQDLGIQANTVLSDEANTTLFKVIPRSANEALQKIKEALDIYMNAPAAPSFPIELISTQEIAVAQWQSNILHLKSQLLMSQTALQMNQATIQMKDTTIESLQLSNYQLKEILKEKEKKESHSEDLISGLLSVDAIESNGFKLNLAEVLRRLKRKFAGK